MLDGYGWFTGCVEVGGALLLLWRRTALLGGLIVTAALTNILLLNLSYDVPAKLFVAHLLAAALFLLWLDRTRLLDFFVRNRPVAAADLQVPHATARLGTMHIPVKGVVVATLFAPILWQQGWFVYSKASSGNSLSGTYRVTTPDGRSEISNPAIIVIDGGSMSFWDRDGKRGPVYRVQLEPEHILLNTGSEQTVLACQQEGDVLEIQGVLDGMNMHWQLTRTAPPGLLSHTFHWVSEWPHRSLPDPDPQTVDR